MNLHVLTSAFAKEPYHAVDDLLAGRVDLGFYSRLSAHELLLRVLPQKARRWSVTLLNEPVVVGMSSGDVPSELLSADELDRGLSQWLIQQRDQPLPKPRKLSSYAAQVSEALQWPFLFDLPLTLAVLRHERWRWVKWFERLWISEFRDPEYDYWQCLSIVQADDSLQAFWQQFVVTADTQRPHRYLDLGLNALAKLPLGPDDDLRNLRLQVQSLVSRFRAHGETEPAALSTLSKKLLWLKRRRMGLRAESYYDFLKPMLLPLGEARCASVYASLGLSQEHAMRLNLKPSIHFNFQPPGLSPETDAAVLKIRAARTIGEAWSAMSGLLSAHEKYMLKTGEHDYFVKNLDRCARALCNHFKLNDIEIRNRLFQWIHLSLRVDSENPRLWMLWNLALKEAGLPQRAEWVLWEMTRRFPDQVQGKVELARLLAYSKDESDVIHARRLLDEVLQLDPNNLHALSTLAQMAVRSGGASDLNNAVEWARKGLDIDPSNEPCAVLLAQAKWRRNQTNDQIEAIEGLETFTRRNANQPHASGYLQDLYARRAQTQANSTDTDIEDMDVDLGLEIADAKRNVTGFNSEEDPAWIAFRDDLKALSVISLDTVAEQQSDGMHIAIPGYVPRLLTFRTLPAPILA